MTELIVGSRNSGKTTELIKRSATDGLYILTGTKRQARCIFDQARDMGYDIPFPVTWAEFQKGHFQGSSIQKDGLLIDEAGWLLSYIFKGIPIKGVTWTKYEDFRDLDEEKASVAYLCDRHACDKCVNTHETLCCHTTDIRHALDFEERAPGKFMQKERDL